MSIDRRMDKEDVIHVSNGILAIKKNKIMPFEATRMDLEIIILSEVSQTKTNIIWHHLYVKSKKIIHMKLFIKQNRLIDIENKLVVTKGEGGEGVLD